MRKIFAYYHNILSYLSIGAVSILIFYHSIIEMGIIGGCIYATVFIAITTVSFYLYPFIIIELSYFARFLCAIPYLLYLEATYGKMNIPVLGRIRNSQQDLNTPFLLLFIFGVFNIVTFIYAYKTKKMLLTDF